MGAKIIILGNQKGGVGKSSLTMIFANHLHLEMKKKVLIIDANAIQKTIFNSRAESIEDGVDPDQLYHVVSSSIKDVPGMLENFVEDYDYIFIDVPGNLGEDSVLNVYLLADYIFIPTNFSVKSIDSTVIFLNIILNKIVPIRKNKGYETSLHGIGYMMAYKGRNHKRLKQDLKEGNLPIPFLKTVVPYSEVLEDNSNTHSTLNYISTTFDINDFMNEFENIINQ